MGIVWGKSGFFLGRFSASLAAETRKILLQHFLNPKDYNPDRVHQYEESTFFPRLAVSERMKTLGAEVAGAAFGKLMTCRSAQIALRFPERPAVPWHVDKVCAHAAALMRAPIDHPFKTDAIVGLYLSPVTLDSAPLTLDSASHTDNIAFAKEHGYKMLRRGVLPKRKPEPVVIIGDPGQAIMMHPLLTHMVPENKSNDIRVAVYFRMIYHGSA